jgi:hypothetical protein
MLLDMEQQHSAALLSLNISPFALLNETTHSGQAHNLNNNNSSTANNNSNSSMQVPPPQYSYNPSGATNLAHLNNNNNNNTMSLYNTQGPDHPSSSSATYYSNCSAVPAAFSSPCKCPK